MRYTEFRAITEKYPLFNSKLFKHWSEDVATLRRQVSEWIKQGYVIKVKRGIYTLNNKDRLNKFSRMFLANQLYWPSFVSLEYALSYYGLIPEKVTVLTSVTPKKTQVFGNEFGQFEYHHVKINAYENYISRKDEFSNTFYIATPERALVDYLYFRTANIRDIELNWFDISMRLQNTELLDKQLLRHISKNYAQNKLSNMIETLILFLESK